MTYKRPPSRRQVKMARVLRDAVSDVIMNHLNDPRIEGLVSVTEVDVSPDLRKADVSLSILARDEAARRRTLQAIVHASRHIQMLVGRQVTSRYCPRLHLCEDQTLHKTLETLNLIETIAAQRRSEAPVVPLDDPDGAAPEPPVVPEDRSSEHER